LQRNGPLRAYPYSCGVAALFTGVKAETTVTRDFPDLEAASGRHHLGPFLLAIVQRTAVFCRSSLAHGDRRRDAVRQNLMPCLGRVLIEICKQRLVSVPGLSMSALCQERT